MAGEAYVPRRPPELPRSTRVRKPRTPRWVFHVRRAVAVIVLVLIVAGVVRACGSDGAEQVEDAPVAVEAPPDDVAPGEVASSRPVEMRIPAVGLDAKFESGDCRVVDGALDPESLGRACAYTAADKPYVLPGSDAEDIVVIAGHAAAGVSAVFDKLYDPAAEAHTLAAGDEMFVRTEASGQWWLRYVATDLHEPTKDALAGDVAIWGSGPMPGRLLTISCIQPANPFKEAVSNAVVGWRFAGVVSGEATR